MTTQTSRSYPQGELPMQFDHEYGTELSNVGLPEPIQELHEFGRISNEEEALARRFFHEVHQSQLLPQINAQRHEQGQEDMRLIDPRMQEIDTQVRGIFALLNSVDEQLLGTVCALLLELKLTGHDRPLPVEEVGRRIMGYSSPEANAAAGATLLRAALWIVRFGYQNPKLCQILLAEKQQSLEHTPGQGGSW